MSQKPEIVSLKINDDQKKLTTKPVVPEFRQGVCASAYVESLKQKNDKQITAVLQHAKLTESHAC
jgi:hypothetical protein